ncbi:hypothetical protein [Paracoccus pantotrophus]|uniref:hypothetical protein n=1 Tax=Paracoccus pantotrophus TaxID=82367 RepID=UPI00048B207F|nr:hypothetical protein [Paracoccus pantotrophus]
MVQITLTQFTPAQAEKITGISVDQQRNLRRHGYLAQSEGHARFDGFGLARLLAIRALSDRGIGPSLTAKADESQDIATLCATGILWALLDWVDAYEGDHKTFAAPWPPSRPRSEDEMKLLIEVGQRRGYSESDLRKMLDESSRDWAERSEWLKKQVIQKMGARRVIPARYFIWWADGTHTWEHDLDASFSGSAHDPRYEGAVIILDQEAMGSRLLSRAGTAFAHIEAQQD